MTVHLFQIYYDNASRAALHPEVIPLDNTDSEGPDWFELWPIRKHLHQAALVEGDWYGFLSPKFSDKFGFAAQQLKAIADRSPPEAEALIFSPVWEQSAYFLNAFEQGDFFMPGLMEASQLFLDQAGIDLNLSTLVGTPQNTVFSNFIVAKPAFWRDWLALADKLVECDDGSHSRLGAMLARPTDYATPNPSGAPLKVFVQERLACVVLARGSFMTGTLDVGGATSLAGSNFVDDPENRALLEQCEAMKLQFADTGQQKFLDAYHAARQKVRTAWGIKRTSA